MAQTYQFHDFMYYPNIALKIIAIQPFNWSGAVKMEYKQQQYETPMWYLNKFWFLFGATNLIYQNLGMLIYLLAPQSANLYTAANMEPEKQIAFVALLSETGSIMGLTLVSACKMFIIFWHGKRISKLLEDLMELFPSEREQSDNSLYRVQYFAKNSGNLMKRTAIFFIFAFSYYNSLPFVEIIYQHLSEDMEIMYNYQSNTWYPWQTRKNSKSWWNFMASYLCQMQSSLTGAAFMMAGEFILCFLITQMQLHFDYLSNALMKLDASSANANDDLKHLIAYHIKLLRFSKEINYIFNISFLVNFITSSVAICLMGFSMTMISMAHTLKYSVGLLSFLVFNFFTCYQGSEFTASGDELMSSAFYNNWYEGDLSYRRMILFFMMRSSESNVLRAYKFATVSMPTFMAILQLSYRLFTFLTAMD